MLTVETTVGCYWAGSEINTFHTPHLTLPPVTLAAAMMWRRRLAAGSVIPTLPFPHVSTHTLTY